MSDPDFIVHNQNEPLVYLNGAMTPLSQAKVSVLDRGFIFGDGIYEVIPMYQRVLFRAEQHLARLFRSLSSIGIENPHSAAEWLALIDGVTAERYRLSIRISAWGSPLYFSVKAVKPFKSEKKAVMTWFSPSSFGSFFCSIICRPEVSRQSSTASGG